MKLYFFIIFALISAAACTAPINRHDPNVPCRLVAVDYTLHPLYGRDCNDLAVVIEQVTGRLWVMTFSAHWLDCHPYSDPLARMDLNWDGFTDLRDFAILARCRIVYITPSGSKYHTYWDCQYLTDENRKSILFGSIGKRTLCKLCEAQKAAAMWLEGN